MSVLNILGRKHIEVSVFTQSLFNKELTPQLQWPKLCSTNREAAVGRICGG